MATVIYDSKRHALVTSVGRSDNTEQLGKTSEDSLRRPLKPLELAKEWRAFIDQPRSYTLTDVIAVVGSRGSGRGTLCTALANAYVSKRHSNKDIVLVDLDPLSPLFSLHGQVSAWAIRAPIIGPAYTLEGGRSGHRAIVLIRAHCLPPSSIRDNQSAYVAAAQELVDQCRNVASSEQIIIVRLPELAQGFGNAANMSLLRLLAPTTTVYLTRGPPKSMEDIADTVASGSLILLPVSQATEPARSQEELHDMAALSIFHERANHDNTSQWDASLLACKSPLCVSFDSEAADFLGVVCLPTPIPSPSLPDLLNGSLVSIVTIEDERYLRNVEIDYEPETSIPFVRRFAGNEQYSLDPQKSRLIGVALVRGVSASKRHLQLIVPSIFEEEVKRYAKRPKMILLVLGCVSMPKALLLEHEYASAYRRPHGNAMSDNITLIDSLNARFSNAPYVEMDDKGEITKREGEAKWKSRRFNISNG
jgi:polynucleotide 5'-kinase involved in rRNA processing